MVLIAVGQICSTKSLDQNLEQCREVVRKAADGGARAIFLPESADFIAHDQSEATRLASSAAESPFVAGLRAQAVQSNIAIYAVIHEPAEDGQRLRNNLILLTETGKIEHLYSKIHLLDIRMSTATEINESDLIEPGATAPEPIETFVGCLGPMICYDLRFPEIAASLVHQGAKVLLYPSAFLSETGKKHWRPLLQARAIECQAYIVAPDQVGDPNEKRSSYGHSLVIDPWGEVLVDLGDCAPVVGLANIDLEAVDRVREQMPMQHKL